MRRPLLLATAALCVAATPAFAHGIGDGARDKSVLEFVPLGAEHMLLGWDHLLFILGVVLFAGQLGRAAKLISLFVAGHSLTLIVATLAEWQVNATAVDVVIAVSVVFVGARGILGRPEDWRPFGAAVLAFGLVHGLGLSTRLQALGLPDDGLVERVVAFNVGIELGQLAAIAAMVLVVRLTARFVPAWRTVREVVYAGLVTAGIIAALVLTAGGFEDETSLGSEYCSETDTDPPAATGGSHPERRFYRPGQRYDGLDLIHVIGDGFVVVRYRADVPAAERDALAAWIEDSGLAVVGAPAEQDEPLKAYAATRVLTCSRVDVPALERFSQRWFEDLDEETG